MRRAVDGFEKEYLDNRVITQLAMRTAGAASTQRIVKKLSTCFLPGQLSVVGDSFIANRKPLTVNSIPSTVKSLEEAAKFAFERYPLDYSSALGSVCASENFITITCNHCVGDGGYLKDLMRVITTDEKPVIHSRLPLSWLEHDKGIADKLFEIPRYRTDPKMTRIHPHPGGSSSRVNTIRSTLPIGSRPKGLTERQWVSILAAYCSFSGDIGGLGLGICYNLRPTLKKSEQGLNVCNYFACIPIHSDVSADTTCGEVARRLREDLKYSEENQYIHASFRVHERPIFKRYSGFHIDLSSVGEFHTSSDVKDVLLSFSPDADLMVPHTMTYSYNGVLKTTFHYKLNQISTEEMQSISDKFSKALRVVDMNQRFSDLVKVL